MIVNVLIQASEKTSNEELKLILIERAISYTNLEFASASLSSAKQVGLPIELMIGFLPSWRYEKRPKTYSGLLASPNKTDSSLLTNTDRKAIDIIQNLCNKLDIEMIIPSATLPKQVTCDIIALASDLTTHSIHIAHFSRR